MITNYGFQLAGYALIAEVRDLDTRIMKSNIIEDIRVSFIPYVLLVSNVFRQIIVDHAGLMVHLCADTASALTSFIGGVTSDLKPPYDPQCV